MAETSIAADASSADLWKVAVPALAALVGVVVGGLIQTISAVLVANTQRKHRLAEEQNQLARAATKLDAERSYVRAVLARHLESYARECAKAMWDNDNPEEEGATGLPKFPDWPEVDWALLGAREMMKARDIEMRVALQHEAVEGTIWHGASSEDEAREYLKEGSGRIGLEAWDVACSLRQQAGVEAFEFPAHGPDFAAALKRCVRLIEEEKEKARADREARRAAGADDLDL